MEACNMAEMRDALMKCEELFSHPFNDHEDEVDCTVLLLEAKRKVRLALSKPPRQCDVGTSDEQAERFENFCLKHIGCAEETGGRHCVGCPLEKASRNITQKCELYWAQMPYAEEGDETNEKD